jgi:hypothetical protein
VEDDEASLFPPPVEVTSVSPEQAAQPAAESESASAAIALRATLPCLSR